MARIALGLAYDGSKWRGWQTQPGGKTIQDALEAALASFLAKPVGTVCAGRTDAGVHALEQVVHLDTDVHRRDESWVRGLNAMLPPSVRIQWARPVDESFHARFSATARTYFYLLRVQRVASPILHDKVGWSHRPIELERMRDTARLLVGEHDFSAFRAAECQAASPVRTLQQLEITQLGDFFIFIFKANAFLQHMVRNLMGALVAAGQGKVEPAWVAHLLLQRDRRLAPATFSAAGLYLARAEYPGVFGLPSPMPSDALASHLGIVLPPTRGTPG